MNIKEYISSGIVESYVLGLTSHEEQLEFEHLLATNAELRHAKEAVEVSLEQHALDGAVIPSASLKQKIWNDLNLTAAPAFTAQIKKDFPADGNKAEQAPVRSMGFTRFLAAASIVLLIGSTALNFYFYHQYKSSTAQLNELIASNTQLADNRNVMQARLQQYERSFEIMKDTNMAVVAMKGQPVAPQSLTTVYYDKQTRDVYLLVNSLPKAAPGKQYQLWAIVDGKPVSAGLLEAGNENALVKMKNIPKAQAFAITLENTGGSTTPTVPIYVVGQI